VLSWWWGPAAQRQRAQLLATPCLCAAEAALHSTLKPRALMHSTLKPRALLAPNPPTPHLLQAQVVLDLLLCVVVAQHAGVLAD